MDRIQGHKDVKVLECTNPVKGLWRMRWDIIVAEDSNSATYMEEQFDHKPTKAEVKALIHQYYNDKTEENITSGLRFEGSVVWLSTENQANYKAAYDLAVQTQGESLPYKVKLGVMTIRYIESSRHSRSSRRSILVLSSIYSAVSRRDG